ncbi:putative phiE125 gp8 family phage protein [Rhizobium sp. PP-F2F-G48]|uniref:head-tail connector protein n=1 Tax=Rhizobium sp. PP-F2F-G48 TaxID=2135651 RepID=UPI0010475E96|nr:phage head-tail connector protein [Rhizobium sp. PP-F2F-G48]TCM55671.1 putative phiE125 gp8 family phage protein [Rhizobium sp. PP-F2F-G48]
MTIAELAPPVGEPLTLAEARAHLRIDDTADDPVIADLITTVREHLERTTGLVLIARSFRLYLDRWPQGRVLEIGRGPIRSIETITGYDALGAPFETDMTGFVLDGGASPPRLFLPAAPETARAVNGIEIDFTAGFGTTGAEVPASLKRALLLHLALLHAYRGAVSPGDQPADVPAGYDRLVAPFRRMRL